MRKSRTSPTRSEGDRRPSQRYSTRSSQSFTASPARSSKRLTAIVDEYKGQRESLPLTPLGKTVLNDDTNIEQPRRASWWKQVDNSRDVIEVLQNNKPEVVNDVLEEFDVEVLSQSHKKDHTADLPDSSDNETINSIVLPQRRLFTQKENIPQKKYEQVIETRETMAKNDKTTADDHINDKAGTKNLFGQSKRTKPIFPSALLNISPDKTIGNKTKELVAEVKAQPRSLFGNRPGPKRKNVFADFIVSESEEEIPDIEPKRFAFSKRPEPIRRVSTASRGTREPSPTMSITTDIEMDDWKMLPSSTMVEHQLEVGLTPGKKVRLSKLSEAKESEAGTGITGNTESRSEKSKSSMKSNKEIADDNNEEDFNLTYDDNEQPNDEVLADDKTEREPRDKTHTIIKSINKTDVINMSKDNKNKTHTILKSSDKTEQNISVKDKSKLDSSKTKNKSSNKSKTFTKSNTTRNKDATIHAEGQIGNDMNNEENEFIEIEQQIEHQDPIVLQKPDQLLNDIEQKLSEIHNEDEKVNKTTENIEMIHSFVNKNKSGIENIAADDQEMNVDLNEDYLVDENDDEKIQSNVLDSGDDTKIELDNDEQDVDESVQQSMNDNEELVENNDVHLDTAKEDSEVKDASENEENVQSAAESEAENEKEYDDVEIETGDNKDVEANDEEIEADDDENADVDEEIEADVEEDIEAVVNEADVDNEIEADVDNEIEADVDNEIEADVDEKADVDEEIEADVEEEIEVDDNEADVDEENEVDVDEETESAAVEENEDEMNNEDNDDQDIEAEDSENDGAVDNLEQSRVESDQEEVVDNSQEIEEPVDDSQEIDESQAEADEEEMAQEDSEEQNNETLEREDDYDREDNEEVENQESEAENEVESHDEIENTDDTQESNHDNNQPNESLHDSHDTTGRHRHKNISKSPEAILHGMSNQENSFNIKGRNTSIRKKSILKNFSIRPSMAPPRESTGISDGTKNSSAEGSGWDSHRTTRKTLRQTFGKDFTPRKSLRALVMEKSAKRQTQIDAANADLQEPQANSTELHENLPAESEMDFDGNVAEPEISMRTRQTTLEMYLQKIKNNNMERNKKIEEQVRNSFKPTASRSDFLNRAPYNPLKRRANTKSLQKPVAKRRPVPSMFPLEDLPIQLKDDMQYKPPKRFRPSNAPWITKRLYKYLETKLEPKYDYKARVRAEKLVETIYHFAKDTRRYRTAQPPSVIELKKEMARLNIVKTHYDFYNFFHDYMPVEVKVKVVPDIVNEIPLPREGLFSNIVTGE